MAVVVDLNTIDELKRLSRVVSDLETAFRAQREQLKQKGMSLPPSTLQGIQTIYTGLDALATQLREEQTELDHLRALSLTAELINSTLEIDEVLNEVMSQAILLTRAERGYLVLRDTVSNKMVFRVARDQTGRLSEGELIVSSSVVEDVARTGNPVLTADAQGDTILSDHESVVDFKLVSILCVPLLLRGEVTGVIYVDNRAKRGMFTEKELKLLYSFANQAAIAIENARLFERARANLDEVTSVKALMDNIFDSIASGVITTDIDDQITTLNIAAERILEIPHDTSRGNSLWDILPAISETLPALMAKVFAHNMQELLEAMPTLPERGDVILTMKLSPLKNTANMTHGVAIVVDDLTEARHREAQVNSLRRYLPPEIVNNIQSIDQLGLGGERREITTLFIDVRGFSTFPTNVSPHQFMETLNEYLTVAADAISKQGGIIDKYMANEIMALFNTQLNEDAYHSLNAILAALNMADVYLDAFYPFKKELPGTRYYRAGIHTGIVTLGNAGSVTRKEFTALGDSINLTHRVLENAQPGQILISHETYEHCAGLLESFPEIEVLERGQTEVKGRRQPVGIYEVRRTREQE